MHNKLQNSHATIFHYSIVNQNHANFENDPADSYLFRAKYWNTRLVKIPNERSSATYVFISSWYDFYSSLVIILYLAKDQSRIIEHVQNKFFFVHISYSHPQNDYSAIRKSIFIPALSSHRIETDHCFITSLSKWQFRRIWSFVEYFIPSSHWSYYRDLMFFIVFQQITPSYAHRMYHPLHRMCSLVNNCLKILFRLLVTFLFGLFYFIILLLSLFCLMILSFFIK